MAAYLKHAAALEAKSENRNTADGKRDTAAFLEKALAATLNPALTAEELTALALETGEYGVTAMALLDEANTLLIWPSGDYGGQHRGQKESGNSRIRP